MVFTIHTSCAVLLNTKYCHAKEPAPAWSRGHAQHQQSEVPAVMTTATGSRGHVQHQQSEVPAVMTTATGSRGHVQHTQPHGLREK